MKCPRCGEKLNLWNSFLQLLFGTHEFCQLNEDDDEEPPREHLKGRE